MVDRDLVDVIPGRDELGRSAQPLVGPWDVRLVLEGEVDGREPVVRCG